MSDVAVGHKVIQFKLMGRGRPVASYKQYRWRLARQNEKPVYMQIAPMASAMDNPILQIRHWVMQIH